jgi:hypothetical protein
MLAVMNKVRDRISAMMSVQKPLRARLLEVAEAHLKATFQFDIDGLMRETKSQLSDDQTALIREAEERMYGAIEKAFQHAIDDGEILDINSAFAAHAYVSLLKVGNVQLADDTSLFQSSREASENIVSLLWNGIKQ